MWSLSPPSSEQIRLFLAEQRGLEFSYPEAGHSLDRLPAGYNFSRPRYWPVRLAKPLARGLQRRFVVESMAAMQLAVREARRP